MVADDLALSIAAATVRCGARVLDPFCGSGRLLMAASALGARSHGFDVNPLAFLITRAKASQIPSAFAAELEREATLAADTAPQPRTPLNLRHTKVAWFSEGVATELAQIIEWLTSLRLDTAEMLVAAVALSAATRDAAWIRKSGWKLHRMNEGARAAHNLSAWACFTRRLHQYARHARKSTLTGSVEVTLGRFEASLRPEDRYDVVLTSPPYGDSKSTVQYGAASGICLDVITRLPGLDHLYRAGGEIDRACLGSRHGDATIPLKQFWAGAAHGEPAQRVSSFLLDFKRSCRHLREALVPGGTIVMVVGRRSVGGYRVRLDEYAKDVMTGMGLRSTNLTRRRLVGKTLPRVINRFARAADPAIRSNGTVKTMDEEWILTFQDVRQ